MTVSRTWICVTWLATALACGGAPAQPAGGPAADPLAQVSGHELYRRGILVAGAGDFVRAEQYLVAAIARGYPEARALPLLLQVCLGSSRLRAALRYAEPYLERHPDAWSLRYLVATIRLGLGDVERARAELERVIADAPDQPPAYYLLGVVLRDEAGENERAASCLARYVELAPRGQYVAEASASLKRLDLPAEAVRCQRPGPALAPAEARSPN